MAIPFGQIGLRAAILGSALAVAGCDGDVTFGRFGNAPPAEASVYVPPKPDERGIITYDSYQVAVAERGDTVRAMAGRFGQDVDEMARLNGIHPETTLRAGEIVVLPRGVDGAEIVDGRIVSTPVRRPGEVDIETIASDAIESAAPQPRSRAEPEDRRTLNEPYRYRVKAGDTASGIAREFDISVRALADWNGLGPDNAVRVGQSLLIPPPNTVVTPISRPVEEPPKVSRPGTGSAVPQPPSASKPLPENRPAASAPAQEEKPAPKPAEAGGRLMLPVNGRIIQDFEQTGNEGVLFSVAAGSPVVAAESGRVGSLLAHTNGSWIVVISHPEGLYTVYAPVEEISVIRGDFLERGQQIGIVAAGEPTIFKFETRIGFGAVDPAQFLN